MNFSTFLTEVPEFNDKIKTAQSCAEFLQDLMSLNADLIRYLKNPALRRFLIKLDNEEKLTVSLYKEIDKALKSANMTLNTLEGIESDVNDQVR
jgi:hypothetical protein